MERLIGSDAALGQLLDNIAVLVARVDLGGTFLYASAAAWAIFGRDPHQLLGTQVLDLVHPSDRAKAESRMREAGSGTGNETQMLLRIVRPDGETVWIQAGGRLLADPESGERSIAFVAFEATARVEAEAARDRTEARFRDLIEWLPAVVYEAEPGPDGRFLYVSPQISELLGYDDREWLARPELWRESIHPEERERVLDLEREQELQSLETDTRIASEYRMQHRSGRTVWVRDVARISRGSGDGRFWRGVMIDISAERTAQLALADAHERHRGMVDSLPACSYRAERRAMGSWQFVSSQIERLLGYTPREWCADPTLWRASLHADDRDRIELEEQRHMEMPPGTEARARVPAAPPLREGGGGSRPGDPDARRRGRADDRGHPHRRRRRARRRGGRRARRCLPAHLRRLRRHLGGRAGRALPVVSQPQRRKRLAQYDARRPRRRAPAG